MDITQFVQMGFLMIQGAVLTTKRVGEIQGNFVVPAYQRGYRWGRLEVQRLLDDVYSCKEVQGNDAVYYLQPIVVKKDARGNYELIDGQQRLTTIFLVYKFMAAESKGFIKCPKFVLEYVTRGASARLLNSQLPVDVVLSAKDANRYKAGANKSCSDIAKKRAGDAPYAADVMQSLDGVTPCVVDGTCGWNDIDSFHICGAYRAIADWFKSKASGGKSKDHETIDYSVCMTRLNDRLSQSTKVIWYEVPSSEDANKIFRRLNIGRIPLTNAELVKTVLLKDEQALQQAEITRQEVVLIWDLMERQLREADFWAFIAGGSEYATHIDLLLNLIYGGGNSIDKYATFFKIMEQLDGGSKAPLVWQELRRVYFDLHGWFCNSGIYHKVGYLTAVGVGLRDIYKMSKSCTKSEFESKLDNEIRKTVACPDGKQYGDLSYECASEKSLIQNILLLFNVIETMHLDGGRGRFSFASYQAAHWSLEHIYAQNSQELKKLWQRQEWLRIQRKYVSQHDCSLKEEYQKQSAMQQEQSSPGERQGLPNKEQSLPGENQCPSSEKQSLSNGNQIQPNENQSSSGKNQIQPNEKQSLFGEKQSLLRDIDKWIAAKNTKQFSGNDFENLCKRVTDFLLGGFGDEGGQIHTIDNLALLDMKANSALGNSIFSAKRDKIIEKDENGEFIPHCTKMVFLKYYTKGKDVISTSFWSDDDKSAYVAAINEALKDYLSAKIETEHGGSDGKRTLCN